MSDRIRLTPAMRDLLLEIWQNGSAYPLDRNHKRTFEALERGTISSTSLGGDGRSPRSARSSPNN